VGFLVASVNITVNDLHIFNYPCIPGMKSTWSWCIMPLIFCLIWFATFLLRIFTSKTTENWKISHPHEYAESA
jgi:hypothetical protein